MICPNCGAPIGEHVTDYGDYACVYCGLAGSRDVLKALAARLGPAGTLAEAERLLRAADVFNVGLWPGHTLLMQDLPPGGPRCAGSTTSLAEAYEQLTGGRHG